MKLALHQFQKDVRQFRVWLGIWLLLLILDLAANLGWAGDVRFHPISGYLESTGGWTEVLPTVTWVLVLLLPSLAVLADSPARRDGFLATRPILKSELFLGKLIFSVVLVVLPWVLAETVHLILRGAPVGIVLHGTMERLLFTLPAVILAGAFASLWSGMAMWAGALAVTGGAVFLSVLTLEFVRKVLNWSPRYWSLNTSEWISALLCLSLFLSVFAVWHACRMPGWRTRLLGLTCCALMTFLAAKLPHWRFAELRPEDIRTAEALVQEHPPVVPWTGIGISPISTDGSGNANRFDLSLNPEPQEFPDGLEIDWSAMESAVTRTNGAVFHTHRNHHTARVFGRGFGIDPRYTSIAAWAGLFPENTFFRVNAPHSHMSLRLSSVHLFQTDIPKGIETEPMGLEIQSRLKGSVFQWRKAGELPLKPGATLETRFGIWRIAGVFALDRQAAICLEHSQVEMTTARDPRFSRLDDGPHARTALLVHDPANNLVLTPRANVYRSGARAVHTAYPRYFSSVYLQRAPFSESELARMRLVVLEQVWLGSAEIPFRSETFTLDDIALRRRPGGVHSDSITPDELSRRLRHLPAPGADAPRQEVSRYLGDVFRILSSQTHRFDRGHPLHQQLASYVPRHLDLFLAALPELPNVAERAVVEAIRLGATEEQRGQIAAALPRSQQLAEVILKRGWVDDARQELRRLANRKTHLSLPVVQCLALSGDPAVRSHLVDTFSTSPTLERERLLRSLGLGSEAERAVARWWQVEKRAIWDLAPGDLPERFELALRNGHASALHWMYVILNDPSSLPLHEQDSLARAAANGFWSRQFSFNEMLHNDPAALTEWFRKHRPENFVFDPARRQFVLKSEFQNTGEAP